TSPAQETRPKETSIATSQAITAIALKNAAPSRAPHMRVGLLRPRPHTIQESQDDVGQTKSDDARPEASPHAAAGEQCAKCRHDGAEGRDAPTGPSAFQRSPASYV